MNVMKRTWPQVALVLLAFSAVFLTGIKTARAQSTESCPYTTDPLNTGELDYGVPIPTDVGEGGL